VGKRKTAQSHSRAPVFTSPLRVRAKPKFTNVFFLCFFNLNSGVIIYKSGENQQKQKTPIPAGIDVLTGNK
jgi:hypothetical protein